ncbi:MAG: TonB-dependent receptor, partial [Paramuribaculum sp.]|nr:TonB-dependent receptor [Paramuribaculum sp.]
ASTRSLSSNFVEEKILSWFGRLEYDYMDKYLIAATFRSDGYSRLINNRWGFFPGVSAGWVFSKEDFFKNSSVASWWNYGKLRGSFGLNGIVNTNTISYYGLQGAYSAYNYAGNYGYRISALANPNLRWERTRTAEVGIDFGFLANRFNVGLTYYNRLTMDKYANYKLPASTGFSSVVNNNGKFRNQGVEIDFNGTIINTKDFRWTLGANITYNKNIVVELPDNEYANNAQSATYVYSGNGSEKILIGGLQEGQEPNHLIGYKKAYMVRSEADLPKGYIDISGTAAVYSDAEGLARLKDLNRADGAVKLMPGDLVWEDRNGDNMIDAYDQYDLGNRTPHWTGGFNTTFSWKGLQLYARFDMGFDFTVYDSNLGWWLGCGQGTYSFPTEIHDTWTPENPGAKYPRYVWASVFGTNAWTRTSSLLAQNGAYLACRELSLSYQLPENICKKFACKGLTVSVTGQNLGYIKKCTIPLPDNTTYTNGSAAGWGGTYNVPRTLLFGLNVSF